MNSVLKRLAITALVAIVITESMALALPVLGAALSPPPAYKTTSFTMVRSASAVAANCLASAKARVTVKKGSQNNVMTVKASGLPAKTTFAVLILQLPDKPFGVGWYQSDLKTNAYGGGAVTVQGIFNSETFALSLAGTTGGSNATQGLTDKAVLDTNATFRPTSMTHVALWFDDPADAAKAGCGNTQTPFTGGQHAGIQAMSTRNFPANKGPLAGIAP